jgi:AraC-like DNA-binding protein
LFTFKMMRVVATMLAERRVDVSDVLRRAELPAGAFAEVTAPLARIVAFIDRCADVARAPTFGLDLAERLPCGAFGITEFVMRSAPSIEHALHALVELAPLVNPNVRFRVEPRAGGAALHFAVVAQRDALGRHLNEYTLTVIRRRLSDALGVELPLHGAWFAHAPHDHAVAVAQHLGCNVTFAAADCGIAIADDWLARAPLTADPALFEFLLAHARGQLANVAEHDVVTQLARIVDARLATGRLAARDVAHALGLGTRTLQRHLADADTSYRDVVRHVRARRYAQLVADGVAQPEIARRLGFASIVTMRRALQEFRDLAE